MRWGPAWNQDPSIEQGPRRAICEAGPPQCEVSLCEPRVMPLFGPCICGLAPGSPDELAAPTRRPRDGLVRDPQAPRGHPHLVVAPPDASKRLPQSGRHLSREDLVVPPGNQAEEVADPGWEGDPAFKPDVPLAGDAHEQQLVVVRPRRRKFEVAAPKGVSGVGGAGSRLLFWLEAVTFEANPRFLRSLPRGLLAGRTRSRGSIPGVPPEEHDVARSCPGRSDGGRAVHPSVVLKSLRSITPIGRWLGREDEVRLTTALFV